MIHPATSVRTVSPVVGDGVFATEFIPKGTLVWVLCRFDRIIDRRLMSDWPERVSKAADRFGYIDALGRLVVCWNHARMVNHCCDPTGIGVGNGFEIARRDIHPGDQLTCDYGLLNMTESLVCACGATACRGVINAEGADRMEESWDAWAQDAFAAALTVDQPLLPFVRAEIDEDRAIVEALRRRTAIVLPSTRAMLQVPVTLSSPSMLTGRMS